MAKRRPDTVSRIEFTAVPIPGDEEHYLMEIRFDGEEPTYWINRTSETPKQAVAGFRSRLQVKSPDVEITLRDRTVH